ncbi:unnamed protein product [Prorocentrum cordatum]|uniref:Uncharacterized protein n=1 Tax=Prorocentrum cordatum TaxID=2364126 RepID=A0ABN9X0H9_9DINO|nr:unnamed protein product [Polarella glacialis]
MVVCGICDESGPKEELSHEYKGMMLHQVCWNGLRAHNNCIKTAPAHVKAQVFEEFQSDRPAWKKRMMAWKDPSKQSREVARNDVVKSFKAGVEHSTHQSNLSLDDDMVVSLIEFQSWKGFWHRTTDEQSKMEFERLHQSQQGQHDLKDAKGAVIERKIAYKDIGRFRKERGATEKSFTKETSEVSEFEYQQKRRRFSVKSAPAGPGPSSLASAAPPLESSTRVYSSEHWVVGGDSAPTRSAGTLSAETLAQNLASSPKDGNDVGAQGRASDHGKQSSAGGGSKPKLFNAKLGISIDDQTRERTIPSGPEVEAMEPISFMEAKRLWAAMAAHVVKGFLGPTSGYVKQLNTASQAVGKDKEGDLHQPTSELVDKLTGVATELETYVSKCGEQCTKAEFVKHAVVMDAKMTDLDGQRKHVQSQLSGLKYFQEKFGHNKSIAYMGHYNRRVKTTKRLQKGGFGKEYADAMSRALYAATGDEQRASLTEAGKGSSKGKTRKVLPFRGDVEVDLEFNGDKVAMWKDPETATLGVIKDFIDKNNEAITSKLKVHQEQFDENGAKWIGCCGRLGSSVTKVDFGQVGSEVYDLLEGGLAPWVCTVKPDSPRVGPSAVPLSGYECVLVPLTPNMAYFVHPVAEVVAQGVSLKDIMKFFETEEGAKINQASFILQPEVGQAAHVPCGHVVQVLFYPVEAAATSSKTCNLGHTLFIPLLHGPGLLGCSPQAALDATKHHAHRAANWSKDKASQAVSHAAGWVDNKTGIGDHINAAKHHINGAAEWIDNKTGGAAGDSLDAAGSMLHEHATRAANWTKNAAKHHGAKAVDWVTDNAQDALEATGSVLQEHAKSAANWTKNAAKHHAAKATEWVNDNAKDALGGAADGVKHHASKAKAWVADNAPDSVGDALGAVTNHTSRAADWVADIAPDSMGDALDAVKNHSSRAADWARGKSQDALDAAKHHSGNAADWALNTSQDALGGAVDAAKHHTGKAAEMVQNTSQDALGGAVDAAKHHTGKAAEMLKSTSQDALGGAVDAAKHHTGKAAEMLQNTSQDALDGAVDAAQQHASKAQDALDGAVDAAKGHAGKAAEVLQNKSQDTLDGAMDAAATAQKHASKAQDALDGAVDAAQDQTGKAAEMLQNKSQGAIDGAVDAAQKHASTAQDALEGTADNVKHHAGNAKDAVQNLTLEAGQSAKVRLAQLQERVADGMTESEATHVTDSKQRGVWRTWGA